MDERKRKGEEDTSPAGQYTEMPVFVGEHRGHGAPHGGSGAGPEVSSPGGREFPESFDEEETESVAAAFDPAALQVTAWAGASWKVFRASAREFAAVQALVVVLTVATVGLAVGPLHAGLANYTRKRLRGVDAGVNDLFSGLDRDLVVSSLLAGLGFFVALVFSLALDSVLVSPLGRVAGVGWILLVLGHGVSYLLIALISGGWLFLLMLMTERKQAVADAWETLLGVFQADWSGVGWLFLVAGAAPVAGALLFGVGVLVGGPVGMLVVAHAVRTLYPQP